MKIYIAGIAGLIGSNLAKRFLREGYEVRGCDNLIGGYEDNIPCEYDNLDILDIETLKRVMGKADVVIHAAALAYEGLSVFSPKIVAENIYSGTISVATAAISNEVPLFINCSSMARYGNGIPPFKETDATKPQDPYGIAKVDAENMLNFLSSIYPIKVFHVVPHNVLGPGQVYTDPYRNVAAIFANRLLRGKSIYIYGDGEQKRSFSHVDACVEAFYKLINMQDMFYNGEIFNIGPEGNEISIKELAYLVAHHAKIYPTIEFMKDRPQEVKMAWCSSKKAIEVLNYNPNIKNNNQIIKELVEWVIQRGPTDFKYTHTLEIINENTPKTWVHKLI